MINPKDKEKIIKEYRVHETDTGSAEVQISLLSEEIDRLLSHLKKHPKDLHSKRGLLKMVSARRRFLKYLEKKDEKRYKEIVKKIDLKK